MAHTLTLVAASVTHPGQQVSGCGSSSQGNPQAATIDHDGGYGSGAGGPRRDSTRIIESWPAKSQAAAACGSRRARAGPEADAQQAVQETRLLPDSRPIPSIGGGGSLLLRSRPKM